jgi:hypothetical protein
MMHQHITTHGRSRLILSRLASIHSTPPKELARLVADSLQNSNGWLSLSMMECHTAAATCMQ